MASLTKTSLSLPLIGRGKVRDIYQVPEKELLLFVATDRILAYDVILNNGIPDKGKILTEISIFWFRLLGFPNHLITQDKDQDSVVAATLPDIDLEQVRGRALIVRKLKLVPLEVIVRGYLTGLAWKEYQKTGTVHGTKLPAGMRESEKFPTPIFTPSTKAEQGEHDENILKEKAVEIVGDEALVNELEKAAISLYEKANSYANSHGIIIADTKFEFGVDENGKLVLVDEVLTPDSSRFWSKDAYEVGKSQESFDKQYLRNWLTSKGLNGVDDVTIPDDVVEKTREKYVDVLKRLTSA